MDAVAVLGHSKPLPPPSAKDLVRVARRLARSGAFLAVRYEPSSGRLNWFRVPERIPVPESGRTDSVARRGARVGIRRPRRRRPRYRRKAGEREWRGVVQILKGGWWFGRLQLPSNDDAAALLTIERKGKGATLLPKDAALVIPPGEAETLLELLTGLVERAQGTMR